MPLIAYVDVGGWGWIGAMTLLPIRDRAGNTLVDVRLGGEMELAGLVEQANPPASLVVVVHAGTVLMVFDSWRKQWELPGGTREPGETPRQAAVRELREETGIHNAAPTLAGVAEFDLIRPPRRELLAIYRVHLPTVPPLTTNHEALDFRWWPPTQPAHDDMSPLDTEIAGRVTHPPTP